MIDLLSWTELQIFDYVGSKSFPFRFLSCNILKTCFYVDIWYKGSFENGWIFFFMSSIKDKTQKVQH